jgi:hypothetical protein
MAERFTPTQKMAAAARRGLRLREEHGRGGTEVGVRRAEQLVRRDALSAEDVKSMYSYFARHEVDKEGANWADRDDPSAGYIAWLLWGGDDGKRWAASKRRRLD